MIKQFINSFFSSNSFLYINNDTLKCILFDCGDIEPITEYIEEHNLTLIAVFITHSHYDHIYGLNDLLELYPKTPIYTSEHGKLGLLSDKLNLSRYHEHSFVIRFPQNICVINTETDIKINDLIISPIFTPGHDASCVSYRIEKLIFTGDSYLPDYDLVYKFPKSNKTLAQESEINIISQLQPNDIVCPGHGKIKSYNLI